MPTHDEILRRLYRGSIDWPLLHFQEAALDTLLELIPFDSAMWGLSHSLPLSIVDVHLNRQPPEMFEDYLAHFQHDDILANAAFRQLGKAINIADLISREAFEKTRIYREFASHWGVQHALSTCMDESMSSLIHFLSLWRKSPRHPFSEQERAELECLAPHLAEAHRISRITFMRQPGKLAQQAVALCNQRGMLIEVEPGFFELLAKEWPALKREASLPKELLPVLAAAQAYQGKTLVINTRPLGAVVRVHVRALCPLDNLGKRQMAIALRYAAGASYRDIAHALGLAESTVRNHVASIFKKCHLHNKVELAALMQKQNQLNH